MILSNPSRLRIALAGTAVVLLAGCGTSVTGTPAAEGAAASAAGESTTGADAAIDVCSFFTAAEVKELIGSSPTGKAERILSGSAGCAWEDPDTYHSLTVDIGGPDTAINGTLPAWDPSLGPERTLPGGMRDVNGAIEFVCGGTRLCSVQVANAIQGDADQQAGIGLVEKIRAKVSG